MISTPSNLLCLGRSGTGKTTTSALRLFATEAYYKYHDLYRKFKLDNPNARNAEFRVPHDFI
jgi:Cdc6-like AAA superfamily ATPase